MRALTALVAVAMAACSTPSEIVKTGPTTYRVRTDAGGGNPSDAEIKTRGIARANEFCAAQGKRRGDQRRPVDRLASVQRADRRGAILLRRPAACASRTPASAP